MTNINENPEITLDNKNKLDVLEYEKNKGNEEINLIEMPNSEKIPVRLLSNATSKTVKLLGNELDENHMQGKSRWFSFELAEPIYLERIEIKTSGYPDEYKFKLKTKDYNGKWGNLKTVKVSDGTVSLLVNGLQSGIKFEPPVKYLTGPTIKSIELYGLELKKLSSTIESITNIENFKKTFTELCDDEIAAVKTKLNDYAEATAAKDGLGEEIATRTVEVEQLKNKIEDGQKKVTEAERRVEVVSGREADASAKVERLEASILERTTERDQLVAEATETKQTLTSLQKDINMFPSQIKGYVSQGSRNSKLYTLLSAVPLLVIVVMGYRLITSAEELVRNVNNQVDLNVFEILISRLPYVIISITIFGMMVAVLKFLLSEIVNINRKKQELYKINIIATDIADTTASMTNITEEGKMHQLNLMKMEMLRDHLKHTLSDDFQLNFSSFRKKIFKEQEAASKANTSNNNSSHLDSSTPDEINTTDDSD